MVCKKRGYQVLRQQFFLEYFFGGASIEASKKFLNNRSGDSRFKLMQLNFIDTLQIQLIFL